MNENLKEPTSPSFSNLANQDWKMELAILLRYLSILTVVVIKKIKENERP